MCLAQDVMALRIGPAASDWLMFAALAAFYATQLIRNLAPLRAAALR
ncbi:MAG TPA: hypothetical protein VF702_00015 [Allosphingosinicella sp.]|jgi:hypothetical protein